MKRVIAFLLISVGCWAQATLGGTASIGGTATLGSVASAPQAATPVWLPGTYTYATEQTGSVSCATGSSYICYSRDGSTPQTNGSGGCTTGNLYSASFSITSTETDKAVCNATGYLESSLASQTVTIAAAGITVGSGGSAVGYAQQTLGTSAFNVSAGQAIACFVGDDADMGSPTPVTITLSDTASPSNTFTEVSTRYNSTYASVAVFVAYNVRAKSGDVVTADYGGVRNRPGIACVPVSGVKTASTPVDVVNKTGLELSSPFTSATFTTTNGASDDTAIIIGAYDYYGGTLVGQGYSAGTIAGSTGTMGPQSVQTDNGVIGLSYRVVNGTQTNVTASMQKAGSVNSAYSVISLKP